MSEEFDKEAEREKLREKYEKDAEKRSATQRMSELLLGGATMTDQHCDRCGDPLFRDDGETFCPTCRNDEQAQAKQQAAEESVQLRTAAETPDQQSVPQSADGAGSGHAETAESLSQLPDDAEVIAPADNRAPDRQGVQQASAPQPGQQRPEQPQYDSQSATNGDGADPRVELQRAVTETARKANAATDPRTAKAWLEASKEAAEALAVLER